MDGENPIRKVPLFVMGNGSNLIIDKIGGDSVPSNEASNMHEISFIKSQMRD